MQHIAAKKAAASPRASVHHRWHKVRLSNGNRSPAHAHTYSRTQREEEEKNQQENERRCEVEKYIYQPKMWAFKFCIKSQCLTYYRSKSLRSCTLQQPAASRTHTLRISRGVKINIQNESKSPCARCLTCIRKKKKIDDENNRIHCLHALCGVEISSTKYTINYGDLILL